MAAAKHAANPEDVFSNNSRIESVEGQGKWRSQAWPLVEQAICRTPSSASELPYAGNSQEGSQFKELTVLK